MIKKNKFSILVALFIMYLSLANSSTFEKVSVFNFPFFDKIVHFGMYFGLMATIIFENRKNLKNIRALFLVSLISLSYGILMEVLQATLTVSRSGSFYDVIADFAGIIVSVLIWLWIRQFIMKETVK